MHKPRPVVAAAAFLLANATEVPLLCDRWRFTLYGPLLVLNNNMTYSGCCPRQGQRLNEPSQQENVDLCC